MLVWIVGVLHFVLNVHAVGRPQVTLAGTQVLGVHESGGFVEFFGGIPFAEPPLDDLRFRRPIAKNSLDSPTFDARKSGLPCLQTGFSPNDVTENCLTLNIFRPSSMHNDYNKRRLPVLFWIHGGSWTVGSGGRYNGSHLVSRSITRGAPVIFVSANYRLGPLGFPRGEEAAKVGVPNLGLWDNLSALQWVKAHIHSFGGDSSKVTIAGESAGARSIDFLLFNEDINNLASGAILESDGGTALFKPHLTNDEWIDFVDAVTPCSHVSNTTNTLDCLRSKEVNKEVLLDAFNTAGVFFTSFSWGPIIDGAGGLIPDYPSRLPIKARFPVITGSNLDEGTLLQSQAPTNVSSDDRIRDSIESFVRRPPGKAKEIARIVQEVIDLYPDIPSLGSPFGTGNNTFGLSDGYKRSAAVGKCWTVPGDFIFHSYRRAMLNRFSKIPNATAYSYLFTDSNEGVVTVPREFIIGSPAPGSLGVTHAAELFYVFGTLEDELGRGNVSKEALQLSRTIMDYWLSFTSSGNPNDGKGLVQRPRWVPYKPLDPMMLQLDGHNTTMIPDTFRSEGIAVFNEDPVAFRR
ncbi:alpha/beta-hydrolase [Marasmius fiardii PR-910]|nr:alpha/beta-hydrolase [Marasmius fiardii PR-910]